MKTTKFLVLFLSLTILLMSGCAPKPSPGGEDIKNDQVEKVNLFYGDAGNEKMLTEEREITFKDGEDKYKVILEELIKGPEQKDLKANIDKSTKVNETTQAGSDLIVNFSQEFNQFAGSMGEIMAVGSVVNTLIQFGDIERVKILVEGDELIAPSGEERGFMTKFPTEPDQESANTEVILYFSNQNAEKVVGEKRKIAGSPDKNREEFIKRVLESLIAGPESGNLYKTIPEETTVLSVTINQDTAVVDFSDEMHTKHWGGAAGESMTINSIVNTLTEFDFIKKVKITVNQKPLAIEHVILEDAVERNEAMIGS